MFDIYLGSEAFILRNNGWLNKSKPFSFRATYLAVQKEDYNSTTKRFLLIQMKSNVNMLIVNQVGTWDKLI
jgi:hypothetical protein